MIERTAELVLATTAPVLRANEFGGCFELVLAPRGMAHTLEQLRSGQVALMDGHSKPLETEQPTEPRTQIDLLLGVLVDAWIEDDERLVAVARFGTTARALDRFERVRAGELRDVSPGYHVERLVEITEPGSNIRRFGAVRWCVVEASLVHCGAGREALIRSWLGPARTAVQKSA